MKKFVALCLALVLSFSVCACGQSGEGKTPATEPVDVPTESSEAVTEAAAPDYTEIVPGELQGVWMSDSVEGALTFYAYQDTKVETFVVNVGIGGAPLLSGTFTVGSEKINYDLGSSTGYSFFTYQEGVLTLTDGNGANMRKLSAADIMEYLVQEESSGNKSGVICLADILANYFADSDEAATAAERKNAIVAAIKAEGEAALKTLNATYDKVQKLTWYQSKSQPQYVDICCYLYPYIGRYDHGTTWLRVAVNYTDAQTNAGWIFFNTIIFSVDGENTTKYFSRSDILRDNDTEVWETADFEPNATEIALLRSIANSNETIIRFQGDEYYYDHIVTAKEKTAILDVLTAYDYLCNYYE